MDDNEGENDQIFHFAWIGENINQNNSGKYVLLKPN